MFMLFATSVLPMLQGIIPNFNLNLDQVISAYGYFGIIAVLVLESASLPIPSEVVLPLIGLYVYKGTLNFYLAVLSTLVGTFIGITFDYYLASSLGRDVIYNNAAKLHIKRDQLDQFDKWFNNNVSFTVFIARLIPVIRGLISFPAGFARMDKKKFYIYSMLGSFIWNTTLIDFGYYTLGSTNFNFGLALAGIGLLAQLMYLGYVFFMRQIIEDNKRRFNLSGRY